MADLASRSDAHVALVKRLSDWFNIRLTDAQVAQLADSYLLHKINAECVNYTNNTCQQYKTEIVPDKFDARPEFWEENEDKIKGLLFILLTLPQNQVS